MLPVCSTHPSDVLFVVPSTSCFTPARVKILMPTLVYAAKAMGGGKRPRGGAGPSHAFSSMQAGWSDSVPPTHDQMLVERSRTQLSLSIRPDQPIPCETIIHVFSLSYATTCPLRPTGLLPAGRMRLHLPLSKIIARPKSLPVCARPPYTSAAESVTLMAMLEATEGASGSALYGVQTEVVRSKRHVSDMVANSPAPSVDCPP
mmetsp:Transcript_48565/g.114671  ORF Transcript_48565/g.114671 Transcript_48565/m.114671 type:complete len:203 (+) Transcript_48565:964-1572(+)